MTDKKDVINLLDTIADMLEFRGENSFKVNAYRFGAVAIRKMEEDINEVVKRKELGKIKGIGKGIESVIYEYFELGYSILLEDLNKGIPAGVADLMKIKGLGPRKISSLYEQLQITSLDELEKSASDGKVAPLKGFGEALQSTILNEIKRIRNNAGFVMLSTALEIGNEVMLKLSTFKSVIEVKSTGVLRRKLEVTHLIELLVHITSCGDFEREIISLGNYEKNDGYYLITGIYLPILKVYYRINPITAWDIYSTTGSDEFILKMGAAEKPVYKSEEDIFKKASKNYVIPEMREKEYFEHTLSANSNLEVEDIKGLMHFHTTSSDGRNSLEEMVNAAINRNYEYAFVCDHSKSAYYANGLKEERISLQNKEIANVSEKLKFNIWQGIESDIMADGSLDYSEEILREFKLVVASIHSRFRMDKREMTARIIKAVENPYTDILGHPSGRLLLMRDPYEFDVKKVIDACARNIVALEINSNPRRLDLDWRYVYYAREKGCFISINSDAHSIAEIDLINFGVMMGRKAGLLKEEVINCFGKEKFINFLNKKRKRI